MLPLRYVRRWQFASAFLLIFVLASTLIPAVWLWPGSRDLSAWVIGVDKWLHGITFAILAVWFAGLYRPRSYWKIGVGLILFGLFIEACQQLVAYRSAELFDVAADIIGVVIGLLIAGAGLGGWSLRVEGWLVRRREELG
jgi:VanZ family protein